MGKKTVSGFKKRMLVLQCLLRHGEKSINELVDLQLFEMEKTSLNQLVVNLFKDGYLTFRTAQAGERFYAVSEAFESELIDDLGMCAEQPIDPKTTEALERFEKQRNEKKS